MDTEGFRELLKTRDLTDEGIATSIAMAERFEAFISADGRQPDAEVTWAFCKILIEEGNNTYENLLTLARYGCFTAETDPTLKRYYACHCPWAREAIKNCDVRLNAVFCNCSGGFHKKPWEIIFGQTLQVDVLESVLKGDYHCKFAIHLPEKLGISQASQVRLIE